MLFHSTTQAGLVGILASRELWATDLRFFNDSTELHLALDLAEKRVSEMVQSREFIPALALLMDLHNNLTTRTVIGGQDLTLFHSRRMATYFRSGAVTRPLVDTQSVSTLSLRRLRQLRLRWH